MSNPADRVEIITSVQRRRRWTAAEKVWMVEETFEPGMTVSLVARRQWQLLPRRQDTQLCLRHRPRTENHANRKPTEQWNGRSLRPHDQAWLCPRQSVSGCKDRHAPAISLDQ